MAFRFQPIWSTAFILFAGAALLAFSHWTYVRGTPSRGRLLAIRWLAILLVLAMLLRPSLVFSKKIQQSSDLILLSDKSKSMLLRDMWDDQSRWEALVRLLGESKQHLDDLGKEVRVRNFSFGPSLTEGMDNGEPSGEQTAIGDTLAELARHTAGQRLAGVILLSDGTNTSGAAPLTIARQFEGMGVPIHTVSFGKRVAAETTRDIAALSILTNPTVFAKNKLVVRGEFSTNGFANQSIRVRLQLDGKEEARGDMKTAAAGQRAIGDLSAIPDKPGDLKVTLVADKLDGELLPGNNEISTYVTVLAGGISVLYIEGKYRAWEPKFIRWALDQSPDIELNQLFVLDLAGQKAELPKDLFAPGKFDVVILGDVHYTQFDAESLAALSLRVSQGAGLMMTGGYDSFGAGGWERTAVADVLPVRVRASDQQLKQPLKMLPTESGLSHFVMRLGGGNQETLAAWESLSPLDGGSSWTETKPGARLLAESADRVPLLAAQDVGRGRSIAFAGDTTWRWRRSPEGIKAHARFWRQLILWLAHKDETAGSSVKLKLERRRLPVGQKLPIEVRVETADGEPVKDVTLSASVEMPGGKNEPIELVKDKDDYRATFWKTDVAGDYTVRVNATAGGQNLGTSQMKFLVYATDQEMLQLAADHESLEAIAKETGGEFIPAEELPNLLARLKQKDLNLDFTQPISTSLWDRWEALILFVGLVTAEWVLRKRRGIP